MPLISPITPRFDQLIALAQNKNYTHIIVLPWGGASLYRENLSMWKMFLIIAHTYKTIVRSKMVQLAEMMCTQNFPDISAGNGNLFSRKTGTLLSYIVNTSFGNQRGYIFSFELSMPTQVRFCAQALRQSSIYQIPCYYLH